MINFIVRGFLIIFLSRKLREQWMKLIKIIYLTRNLFFILFLDILFFSIIGNILFISEDFSTFFSSLDNMLVMLTTNNFPDVMLKTFPQSKFSIFYFIPFMIISYIVILALLKALYYSNYFEINREELLSFLDEVSGFKLYSKKNNELINLRKKLNNFEISFTESNINQILINRRGSDSISRNYFSNYNEIKDEQEKSSPEKQEKIYSDSNNKNITINNFSNYRENNNNRNNNVCLNYNCHNPILEENSGAFEEGLLGENDQITDQERDELYNYLKIIYSHFSLTKKEIKIIKQVIYLNSDKKPIEKFRNWTNLNNKQRKASLPDNFNYMMNLSTNNNINIINQTQMNDNNLQEIHHFYLSKQSTLNEDIEDLEKNKIRAELDPTKKLRELNKFLLAENENILRNNRFINCTRRKCFEIILNIVNIISIFFLYFEINYKYLYIATVIHMIFCIYFIYEYIQFLYFYSLRKMLRIHFLRTVFFLINIIGFLTNLALLICLFLITLEILPENFVETNTFFSIKKITESFVLLRALRIFILLNKYKEFYTIFTTIHNLKGIFSSIIWTLISFCFIFTTISMILFGGKVDRYRFKDNTLIPENYHNLNFNDYASGFMFCFAMIVINNMNEIFNNLSLIYGQYMKLYFSIFFFLGIILIVNITQMLILEMYLNIKETFSKLNGERGFSKKSFKA